MTRVQRADDHRQTPESSCRKRAAARREAIALGSATMVLALIACVGESAAQCIVPARSLVGNATVTTSAGASTEVRVNGWSGHTQISSEAQLASQAVHMRGALEFEARFENLAVRVNGLLSVANGQLRLPSATPIAAFTARATQVRADIVLVHGLRIRGAVIPCAALEVVPSESTFVRTAPDVVAGSYLVLREHSAMLRESPRDDASGVEVQVDERSSIRFRRVSQRGNWIQIRWEGAAGARLEGWIDRNAVRPEFLQVGLRSLSIGRAAIGMYGTCGHGSFHTWTGPALVRADSRVFSRPSGDDWARVPRAQRFYAHWPRGGEWVELSPIAGLALPGDCNGSGLSAWVHRSRVVLPPSALSP